MPLMKSIFGLMEDVTRHAEVPAPLSERDQVAAELEYERNLLPEFTLLVKMKRRDQKDLDGKIALIEKLERRVAALDAAEAAKVEMDAKVRDLMPKRIEAIRQQATEFHALILQVQQAQDDLDKTVRQFEQDFAGANLNPAMSLIHLCVEFHNTLTARDPYSQVSQWLKEARHVIFAEPRPRPYVDPIELMSPAERQRLVDAQRVKQREQARRNQQIADAERVRVANEQRGF